MTERKMDEELKNTGHWNTGYGNTGNWNSVNRESGFFNTVRTDSIRVFNKDLPLKEWMHFIEKFDFPSFLFFDLTRFVCSEEMTEDEKNNNKNHEVAGGYLKVLDYKEAAQNSFNNASEEDKKKLLNIPNFDSDVFFELFGIRYPENKE